MVARKPKTIVILTAALIALLLQAGSPQGSEDEVTFSRQIARILQKNCQVCHLPGGIGPFSLRTYQDVYPLAQRIREVTEAGIMPPWKPVQGCSDFQGERRLSREEIATIAQWVEAGAPEGDPNELPPELELPKGWALGEPDLALAPEEEYIPEAAGGDIYRCFVMPTNLTEEKYVAGVEVHPGNQRIVHHVLLFIDPLGVSELLDLRDPGPGYTCFGGPGFLPAGGLGGWAPGNQPRLLPQEVGIFLPPHARVVMQVHYHPTGEPEADKTSVGIYFARGQIKKRFRVLPLLNWDFVIPAGAERHEVRASFEIPWWINAHALSITPHMHLLGREMQVKALYPDGTERCLIYINDWDFEWQESYFYTQPVPLPGGTRLELIAYYDNSEKNPRNPNSPPIDVRWGEATTDEMCIAFIGFTLDAEDLTKR